MKNITKYILKSISYIIITIVAFLAMILVGVKLFGIEVNKIIEFYKEYQPYNMPMTKSYVQLLDIDNIIIENTNAEPGKYLAEHKVFVFAVTVACSYIFCKKYVFAVLGVVLGYLFALHKGYKNLDGVNGDVAGYALTVSEFCGILVLALL